MTKQVPWTKALFDEFCERAMLSPEEEWIIRTRIQGWSRQEQAEKLGVSLSTIDRTLSTLKRKYDKAQRESDILPPRKDSAVETWTDEKTK